MSYIERLIKSSLLVKQASSEKEIEELFEIVDRDIKDSKDIE